MEPISCLNCENHGRNEFKCNINHPNYSNRFEADLSICFEKNKLHVSMDKMMDLLDQMNKILDKKNG